MSVSLGLQDAVLDLLKADAGVAALVAGRVYDRIPASAIFPRISFGPTDITEDGADCIESGEHSLQIDVWSRAVGKVEAKRIVDAVKKALHEKEAVIDGGALVDMRVDFRQVIGDPDGQTSHGIVRLTAIIEEDE